MIIINTVERANVLKAITVDTTHIESVINNIKLLQNSEKSILIDIEKYCNRNAVINGLVKKAHEIYPKSDFLGTIVAASTGALNMLDIIQAHVKKSKTSVYDSKILTYKENGMFEWLNAINFFSRYTTKLIDIILTMPSDINKYLNKSDMAFFNQTAEYYKTLLLRFMESKKSMNTSIELLSDEVMDTDTESLIEEIKGKEAVKAGIAPKNLNPVYWYKYGKMLWDVKTFKRNVEEIDMAAMKIQRLENMKSNNPDPSIDQQIEYWQNSIQILNAEIQEIQERYNQG